MQNIIVNQCDENHKNDTAKIEIDSTFLAMDRWYAPIIVANETILFMIPQIHRELTPRNIFTIFATVPIPHNTMIIHM